MYNTTSNSLKVLEPAQFRSLQDIAMYFPGMLNKKETFSFINLYSAIFSHAINICTDYVYETA